MNDLAFLRRNFFFSETLQRGLHGGEVAAGGKQLRGVLQFELGEGQRGRREGRAGQTRAACAAA